MANIFQIKNINLPHSMNFEVKGNSIYITLSQDGMTSNMQENCACFEGWAICLKAKLDKEQATSFNVKITTGVSSKILDDLFVSSELEGLHFKRFLYRLGKFCQTYDWASMSDVLQRQVNIFFEKYSYRLVLNCPTGECSQPKAQEAIMEETYCKEHNNEINLYGRQLPVGIFFDKKSKYTRVMPGEASAIDIWSIDKKQRSLSIYELKTEENNTVGIISELFFYVNIITDLMTNKTVKYDTTDNDVKSATKNNYRHFETFYKMWLNNECKSVRGILLSPLRHPLLTDDAIRLLSSGGTEYRWEEIKIEAGHVSFASSEKLRQMRLLGTGVFRYDTGGGTFKGYSRPYCLVCSDNNLMKGIVEDVKRYFTDNHVVYWGGALIPKHILSSQVSCLNHLFVFQNDKAMVLRVINHITGQQFDDVTPVKCDSQNTTASYIAFEAVSHRDLLNEKQVSRGANCTSIDAAVVAEKGGLKTLIAIEWKYTECYGAENKSLDEKGEERIARYQNLIKASDYINCHAVENIKGSVFFVEPYYQLMRQTLWCEQMIKTRDEGANWAKADDYLHVHIVHGSNRTLLDAHQDGFGEKGMADIWKSLLKEEGRKRYIPVDSITILDSLSQDSRYGGVVNYLRTRYYDGQ